MSFLPLTMLPNTNSTIVTISGLGLDVSLSVLSVQFVAGSSCSSGGINVTASVLSNASSNYTAITATLPSSGLAPNSYTVCVDYLAAGSGVYSSVGSGQIFVASFSSFSPLTVLTGSAGSSTTVTVSGLGLDATYSVGLVQFSIGSNCTNATTSVTALSLANVSGSGGTALAVTQPSTGLPPGLYSVCATVKADPSNKYQNVGNGTLYVPTATSFSPTTVLAGSQGALAPIIVTGVALDTLYSVRSVMLVLGSSCASPTVAVQGFVNVGGSGNTLLNVTLPSGNGIAPGNYSICLSYFGGSAATYFKALALFEL